MDTSRQAQEAIAVKSEPAATAGQRQRRSITEKRRIVEETLVEGASVARSARAHGVNANQLFWLAPALLERKTGEAEADDEVASRASEWKLAAGHAPCQ